MTSPGSHSQDQSQERSPIFLAPSMFVCLKVFLCVFLFLLSYCMIKVQKVQKSHQKCIHKHLPISFFFFLQNVRIPCTLHHFYHLTICFGALPYQHFEERPGASWRHEPHMTQLPSSCLIPSINFSVINKVA